MADDERLQRQLDAAEAYMREQLDGRQPQLLLVLGSGLNRVAGDILDAVKIPFASVPFLCESTVEGHVGQFVSGTLGGKCVLAMEGRLHGYEGYTAQEVAFPVWLAHRLGARVLVTTNAAGGIDPGLQPGDFCIVCDHINFMGRNPLVGDQAIETGPRFFSMEGAYDPELRQLALQVAGELGIHAQEGVYLGLLGPSFETPAEIRAFGIWGASTVAMSMIEEVIAARQVGMKVLGVNMVSNYAAGLGPEALDEMNFEEELARIFELAGEDSARLIEGILSAI